MSSAQQVDVAVLVGRFQPFHSAHLALLQRALSVAPQCVVVIGSAHQARTPKNPFTWTERAEMIRLALPEADRERVRFLPVRDYYDEARWVRAVREGVAALTVPEPGRSQPTIGLVGHHKDATSDYLRGFPGWTLVPVERLGGADGTHLRDALFACAPSEIESTLAAMVEQAPPSTLGFLRAWVELPFFDALVTEWRMLREYKEAWRSAPYAPVFVTVDAVVHCAGRVLLIQRGKAPGKGLYAVPGGFIEARETAYQSALRELSEETHLKLLDATMRQCLKSSAVFDHPDRSLRGRTITHAFHFDLGDRELPEVRADDDAQSVEWMPIEHLASLEDRFHDDHFHMLDHFFGLTADAGAEA
ncbi:MAG: bifunctional nicotinamide-nucleotide adenylyltransferase/Nudix hydroxylase [Rhizobacter sp.]